MQTIRFASALGTIAMNMYSRLSIGEVMRKMARGLWYVWPNPDYALPKDSPLHIGAINWALARWSTCFTESVGQWRRLRLLALFCLVCV